MNKLKFVRVLLAAVLCICISFMCGMTYADTALIQGGGFEVVTDGSGLETGVPVYTDSDGNVLTQMPAGDTVKSSVSMKNTADGEKIISVVCAIYNSENTMTDVSAQIISLGADKEDTVETTVIVPADATDTWSIKTYILETLGNMYSYCESFSFPAEPVVETQWNMGEGFTLSSEDVYDGYSSLKVGGASSECSQSTQLNKNSMYKMSFMGKGDADFSYGIYNDLGDPLAEEKTFEPSEDWAVNSLLFKTSDNENAVIKFKNNGAGCAFVDGAVVSDDILINGGFEEAEIGWELDEICFSVEESEVYEGEKALEITSNSSGAIAYQETDVLAHSKGMISFKSRCSEDICFKVLDADSNELISKVGTTITSSNSWKDNYVYINTLGYDKVKICFETKTSNAKVSYIDNIRFTNLMYSDELVNSDFENGTVGWNKNYSSLGISNDEVFSGDASAHLSERTATYASLSQNVKDILNKYGPGSYYVEGFVKPQVDICATGYMVIRVLYTPKGGAETKKTLNVKGPKAEWNKISGIVDLDWDTEISAARITFETSAGNDSTVLTDLFVDDVSFFKMPD